MTRWIVGIDEVGRGPLAGPVLVCALAVRAGYDLKKEGRRAKLPPLKDSKQLSVQQRREWAVWLKKNPNIHFMFAAASPAIIDRINISAAANNCAWRALTQLASFGVLATNSHIALDGGLYLRNKKFQAAFPAKTFPKADEKNPAVACASIAAKVRRDALMKRMDKKYPGYNFAQNAGYGTAGHRKAIRLNGATALHRKTFLS
jgi:ribonuclease HII